MCKVPNVVKDFRISEIRCRAFLLAKLIEINVAMLTNGTEVWGSTESLRKIDKYIDFDL